MDAASLVRRYYDALDAREHETLASVLDPEFVQRRPDRTFESREAFVRFMREDRPNPETTHILQAVVADETQVAARGRVDDDGSETTLFEFADFFRLDDERIVRLDTYSR